MTVFKKHIRYKTEDGKIYNKNDAMEVLRDHAYDKLLHLVGPSTINVHTTLEMVLDNSHEVAKILIEYNNEVQSIGMDEE